jgi:hypothetical protein
LWAVTASYEISQLASEGDDSLVAVRAGKKRLSTFATALAQTYSQGNGEASGEANGGGGSSRQPSDRPSKESKAASRSKPEKRGNRLSGDSNVKDAGRALFPVERARNNRNSVSALPVRRALLRCKS